MGPAIRLLQLSVEGLSAAKRNIICELAQSHNIDVICLQETHVENDLADRFTIPDFDLICYDLHAKHGRATYVRSNITDAVSVQCTAHCDVVRFGNVHIANVYKSPNEKWDRGVLPVLPHPAVYVGDFNSHHAVWGYNTSNEDGELLLDWAESNDLHVVYDPKQPGTFHSARWRQDYSPDLCWVSSTKYHPYPTTCTVLGNFPRSQHRPIIIHLGLQLPSITSARKPRWNFRKADWAGFTELLERSVVTIPSRIISIEEAYSRFRRAVFKAAITTISRGFRPIYKPCISVETSRLLREYEESGDPDIAEHIIDSLDASRRARLEECTQSMDMRASSSKAWSLVRRLGAAQRPPKVHGSPVTANQVASHLLKLGQAPVDKPTKRLAHDEWR